MSNNATFCRQQAVTERNNADAAVLDNVRDRSARAAASWEAMAVRAERAEKAREDREGVKAAADLV